VLEEEPLEVELSLVWLPWILLIHGTNITPLFTLMVVALEIIKQQVEGASGEKVEVGFKFKILTSFKILGGQLEELLPHTLISSTTPSLTTLVPM